MGINQGFKSLKLIKGIKDLKKNDNKAEAARYLSELFKDEKGLFFKIGQYLGTGPDAHKELKNLSSRKKTHLDLTILKEIIESELQKPFDDIFLSVDENSFSASLAEVFPAKLKNGTNVAIKVQYPNIKKEVHSQLKLLGFLPMATKFSPISNWGFDISAYIDLIFKTLDDELDYKKEIANQMIFKKNHILRPQIEVSLLYPELAGKNFYVQSFMKGDDINFVAKTWSKDERRELSKIILKSFFETLFIDGFIQGDTNYGNFLFSKNNQDTQKIKMIYLDFGNFVTLSEGFRKNLYLLIQNTISQKDIDPIDYLVGMGLDKKKLSHIHSALPLLCNTIFWPFKNEYAFDLDKWDLMHEVDMVLGDNKWWFRSAGSTEFFSVIKSFLGIKNILKELGTPVSWHKIFDELISHRPKQWEHSYPKSVFSKKYSFSSISKKLFIQIKKNDKKHVDLQFPIATLLDLEDYLEDHIKSRLKEKGIILKDIIREALVKGCLPGDVFLLDEEVTEEGKLVKKEYHVFLN